MLVVKSYIFSMLYWSLQLYLYTVFVYILAGWFVRNRYAAWFVFLEELVEPVLARLRRLTRNKLVVEGFDLSPLLLFFFIQMMQWLLRKLFFLGSNL